MRFLIFFYFLSTISLTGQDSTALEKINFLFADLPVTSTYPAVLEKAKKEKKFRIEKMEWESKSPSLNYEESKVVFEEHSLVPDGKCSNCFLSAFTQNQERTIRLTLQYEHLNQEGYNKLLKKILAQVTPFLKSIEQNIGPGGNWETWLLLDAKNISPRIQIAEPSKDFTRIVIDYVSVP